MGSIYKLPNGKWRGIVYVEGKRLSFTRPLRREVVAWVQETTAQIERGLTYDANKTTLAEFLDGWLVSIQGALAWSTHAHYEMAVRLQIKPFVGDLVLREVTGARLQAFYDRLASDELSGWQIQFVHRTLKKSLAHARSLGLIASDPTDQVIVPAPRQQEMQILTETQASSFLASVAGHRNEALYYLATSTGARQGELLGLRWKDVDFTQGTVRFVRQIRYRPGSGLVYSDLKTRYSRRKVELGAGVIAVLRRHQERQWTEITNSEDWEGGEVVFASTSGTPIYPRNLLREFKGLLRRAGLPEIRFHDLRHTAAALMLNHGVPVIVVSRRLGHSRPSITMDIYGHLVPGAGTKAAELIEELIMPVEILDTTE